jgi:beta-lactamase regulating signal transducer with metallopeptidase domain
MSTGVPMAMWMLFTLLISAVVIGAAVAAHDVQRAANRPVRWVWAVAIVAIMGLSVAAPFRTIASPRVSQNTGAPVLLPTPTAVTSTSGAWQWLAATRSVIVTPVQRTLDRANQVMASAPRYTGAVLVSLWLLASLVVSVVLLLSYRRMVQRVREYPRVAVDGVPVRLSAGVGPAVVGLSPSEIVVPAWLTTRTLHEQRMVVTHEAEHIRASDPWLLAAACVVVAIMPWNAALWYALSRLRLAIEIDCDRRVLQRGVHAETYGTLLINLTAVRPSLPIAMPAFPGTHSHLERRILAMTERPVRFVTARRIAGALVAAAVFVTACESTIPTAAEVESMDVASAEKQAVKAGLVDTAHVAYFVDGQEIEERKAKEILASQIASVKVSKARKDGVNEVRIATHDGNTVAGTLEPVSEEMQAKRALKEKAAFEIRQKKLSEGDTDAKLVIRKSPENTTTGEPLIVIDGVISEKTSLQQLELSKSRIESVEVVKGAAATKLYDNPRAVNGVIVVKTKK